MSEYVYCGHCGAPQTRIAPRQTCYRCRGVFDTVAPPSSPALRPDVTAVVSQSMIIGSELERSKPNLGATYTAGAHFDLQGLGARPTPSPSRPPPPPALPALPSAHLGAAALGANAALATVDLLVARDTTPEAARACADMLARAAAHGSPQEVARLRLRRAELLATANKLGLTDLQGVRFDLLTRTERARATKVVGGFAEREWDAGRSGPARWASERAVSLSARPLPPHRPGETALARMSLALLHGAYEETIELATNLLRQRPDDAETVQRCAAALLRVAAKQERSTMLPADRRPAWERSIGIWAAISSSTRFWREFARIRSATYAKEPDDEQIESAADAARDRIQKMLRGLEEEYRKSSRAADRAFAGELVEAFATELDVIRRVRDVADVGLPGPPLPLGPLGMDLFGCRDEVVARLRACEGEGLSSRMTATIRELVGLLGELAEAWAQIANGNLEQAVAVARIRLQTEPNHAEAARVLEAVLGDAMRKALEAEDAGAVERALGWFVGVPLPRPSMPIVRAGLSLLASRVGAARTRGLVGPILSGQPEWARGELEAHLMVVVAQEHAKAREYLPALEQLLPAYARAPSQQLGEFLNVMAHNYAQESIAKGADPDTMVAQLDALDARSAAPAREAYAVVLNAKGVRFANADRLDEAEKALREAASFLGPTDDLVPMVNKNLAAVLFAQAAQAAKGGPYARTRVLTLLDEAGRLGDTDAAEQARKIRLMAMQYGGFR